MRRRKGRSQAPKTGSPLLCSGGGGTSSCKRNGGNKPPSPTLPHLLLLLSALRTSVAPRSCAVNTSSVSTYYVPGTSNRKQSPLPWGASGDPGLSSDTGIMLFSTPQVCCVSESEVCGGGLHCPGGGGQADNSCQHQEADFSQHMLRTLCYASRNEEQTT